MSIKKYTGPAFSEVSTRKRWNGSAWVALTVGKRWNGAAWVDLWGNSSGSSGSSGGTAAGNGVLFSDLKSTVSSPAAHYACGYETTASGVVLSFTAWLNSSASCLGSGIRLTVYARMNGGAWASAVIKASNVTWRGTGTHSVSLTLNGNVSGRTKIELYISRAGSSYGGSAGKIASANRPKVYYIS